MIHIAAAVDRSTLVLFGQKGVTTFPQFRGRPVATTAIGAFGEIALNQTAKEFGMVAGQDFTILFNPVEGVALSAFLTGGGRRDHHAAADAGGGGAGLSGGHRLLPAGPADHGWR